MTNTFRKWRTDQGADKHAAGHVTRRRFRPSAVVTNPSDLAHIINAARRPTFSRDPVCTLPAEQCCVISCFLHGLWAPGPPDLMGGGSHGGRRLRDPVRVTIRLNTQPEINVANLAYEHTGSTFNPLMNRDVTDFRPVTKSACVRLGGRRQAGLLNQDQWRLSGEFPAESVANASLTLEQRRHNAFLQEQRLDELGSRRTSRR